MSATNVTVRRATPADARPSGAPAPSATSPGCTWSRSGADWIDLGTSEDDVAARAPYERLGFTNREGKPDGPVMYVYERDL